MPKKDKQIGRLENKSFRKNYFWKSILLLILFFIVGIIYIFINASNPAVSNDIGVIEKKEDNVKEKTEYERFESNHLSFRHLGSYSLKAHNKNEKVGDIILETVLLADNAINSKKIALTIENLQSRSMTDSANYNMRKKFTDKYIEEKIKIGEDNMQVFSLKGGNSYEKTIFIPREKYLVTLSLSSPITSMEQLNAEFEDIIRSIQWKK